MTKPLARPSLCDTIASLTVPPMQGLLKVIRIGLALTVISLPANSAIGQDQAKTEPKKAKAGQEAQCDGALEIVPQKEMTFTRKRRPSRPASSAPDAAPAKTDRKPTSS
jgi:hypothetical protein